VNGGADAFPGASAASVASERDQTATAAEGFRSDNATVTTTAATARSAVASGDNEDDARPRFHDSCYRDAVFSSHRAEYLTVSSVPRDDYAEQYLSRCDGHLRLEIEDVV